MCYGGGEFLCQPLSVIIWLIVLLNSNLSPPHNSKHFASSLRCAGWWRRGTTLRSFGPRHRHLFSHCASDFLRRFRLLDPRWFHQRSSRSPRGMVEISNPWLPSAVLNWLIWSPISICHEIFHCRNGSVCQRASIELMMQSMVISQFLITVLFDH